MATRRQYRQAAARALGVLDTGTATSGSTTGLLEMTAWPFKSTLAQGERFEHRIIHRPSAAAADRVRLVKSGGYAPLTGMFTPDLPWATAPYAGGVGETIELIGVLDPDTLHRLINSALALCSVTTEVTFTAASTTARRHSLATAAPWLTDPRWVYQMGYLAPSEARADADPFSRSRRGTAFERGGVVYVEGPAFNTTDTAYVLARRPGNTLCRTSGGTYGDQTDLAADTDEAPFDADLIAAGVKMLAWDEFRELWWSGDDATAERKVAQAAARFWAMAREDWAEPERRFLPLRVWGVANYTRSPIG